MEKAPKVHKLCIWLRSDNRQIEGTMLEIPQTSYDS